MHVLTKFVTYVKNWINSIESQYQGFVLRNERDNFPVSLIIG